MNAEFMKDEIPMESLLAVQFLSCERVCILNS